MRVFLKNSRQRFPRWIPALSFVVLGLCGLLFPMAAPTHAFPVPQLPEDNLIVNPWFRDAATPTTPGFDGWTRLLTNGVTWGPSQKVSNPTPEIIVSGVCGFEQVFCGTAARWAKQDGIVYPNIDVVMYQVVTANPFHHELTFFSHWVSHRVALAEISIYGGNTSGGPWTELWTPLSHSQDVVIKPPGGDMSELWEETGFLHKTLDRGYSHYKVEVRARLPEGDTVGFKLTGVYFATEGDGSEEVPLSTVYIPLFRQR